MNRNEEILKEFNSDDIKYIYGYMYGSPYINTNYGKRKDKIIRIPKESIKVGKYNDCLIYVWGWPGPDANIYYLNDYGITWAFTRGDIQEVEI